MGAKGPGKEREMCEGRAPGSMGRTIGHYSYLLPTSHACYLTSEGGQLQRLRGLGHWLEGSRGRGVEGSRVRES